MWKDLFEQGKEIVLVTSSKSGQPHTIVVISQGFVGDKLLINACQTTTSLNNLKENNKVCVVAMGGGEYYRAKGTTELFTEGKYFEISKERNKGPAVKCSIVINISEIFDLDKVKVVENWNK